MKRKKTKGLSAKAVQRQKITQTLLKAGMTYEEIESAFKSYNIERKVVWENGKRRKRTIMLPKEGGKSDAAIRVSLP